MIIIIVNTVSYRPVQKINNYDKVGVIVAGWITALKHRLLSSVEE